MRGRILLLLIVLGGGAATEALPCGNKFLVASRGTRFDQPPVSREAAAVLVYAPPGSVLSEALGDVPIGSVLEEAGYLPITVGDSDQLAQALDEGDWDLVLADLADGESLRARLEDRPGTVLLAVSREIGRRELAEAEKSYDQVIELPLKHWRLLRIVDYAVAMIVRAPS